MNVNMKFQVLILIFILVGLLGKTISGSVISSIGGGICCINNQCYTNCNGISCFNNKCESSNGQPLVPATPEQIQQAQQEANAVVNSVLPAVQGIVGGVLGKVNTLVGNITNGVSNLLNNIFGKL